MNGFTLLLQGVAIILLSIATIKNAVKISKIARDLRRLEIEQITGKLPASYRQVTTRGNER